MFRPSLTLGSPRGKAVLGRITILILGCPNTRDPMFDFPFPQYCFYHTRGWYPSSTASISITSMLPLNCIKMNSFFGKLLCLILLILKYRYICAADPTDGFTLVPLTEENFKLQKPYNEPLDDRYSDKDGVRSFWIYNHDKPFKTDSTTRPRSEARITGHDYSSGIWQFEGYAFVPSGTSGVTIVQIHGAAEGATSLQLRMYDGDIKYYKYNVVATNLYDKWFRVNIIHNVDKGKIIVFIDGVKKFVVKDQGPGDLYFKCGVYAAPENSSNYMESRWKEIKLYKK